MMKVMEEREVGRLNLESAPATLTEKRVMKKEEEESESENPSRYKNILQQVMIVSNQIFCFLLILCCNWLCKTANSCFAEIGPLLCFFYISRL